MEYTYKNEIIDICFNEKYLIILYKNVIYVIVIIIELSLVTFHCF
jgi:hypothetical protein